MLDKSPVVVLCRLQALAKFLKLMLMRVRNSGVPEFRVKEL